MTRLKVDPVDLLLVVGLLLGVGMAAAGLYLLAGLPVTLLVCGVLLAAAVLVVDRG